LERLSEEGWGKGRGWGWSGEEEKEDEGVGLRERLAHGLGCGELLEVTEWRLRPRPCAVAICEKPFPLSHSISYTIVESGVLVHQGCSKYIQA